MFTRIKINDNIKHMFGTKKYPHLTNPEEYKKAFDRRTGDLGRRLENEGVFPGVEHVVEILSKEPRRIYLGIDPTGPDIHIGHTVPLLFLKQSLHKTGLSPDGLNGT